MPTPTRFSFTAKALLKRKIQLEKQLSGTLAMLDKMILIKGQVENANTQGEQRALCSGV